MEFPISCIKENRSNKRMTTISIAIWTFTVSLISFCLNSKRSFYVEHHTIDYSKCGKERIGFYVFF